VHAETLRGTVTALRATFHFKICELFLEPGLLATSHELQRGPYLLRFIFPIESDSERNEPDLTWAELDRRFPTRDTFAPLEKFERRRTSATISMGSLPAVTVVRVDCHFDAPFGVRDFAGLEESRDAPVLRAAADALRDAGQAAREGLREVLDWVRVRGQHWLGPEAGSPRGLAYGELVDLDAGRLLPTRVRLEPDLVIRTIQEHQVLDAARLTDVAERVAEGKAPPLEQKLHADALYMLQDAEPPDLARAVVTAAVACEVKIKRTLRQCAANGQQELLELLLNNPRDWSLALLQLFQPAAEDCRWRLASRGEQPALEAT
jgi:hypothetical protein